MFKFLRELFSYGPVSTHIETISRKIDPSFTEPVIKAGVVKTPTTPIKFPTAKVLKGLTKNQIEELARNHGIELDRRMTKVNMIADFKKRHGAMSKKS